MEKKNAARSTDRIEITPAMIEAGERALVMFDVDFEITSGSGNQSVSGDEEGAGRATRIRVSEISRHAYMNAAR